MILSCRLWSNGRPARPNSSSSRFLALTMQKCQEDLSREAGIAPQWKSRHHPHDSPHFQMARKVSAKSVSSASIVANPSIKGSNRNSGMVGINS